MNREEFFDTMLQVTMDINTWPHIEYAEFDPEEWAIDIVMDDNAMAAEYEAKIKQLLNENNLNGEYEVGVIIK